MERGNNEPMSSPNEDKRASPRQYNAGGALVSVVVPTHNRPEMLARALRSVVSQTYANIEVIVVDDHSDRPAKEVVDRIGDARIRCVRNERCVGGSMARNVGMAHAKGQYVAFLDDDDEFSPDKIRRQEEVFASSGVQKLAMVYTGMVVVDDQGRFLRYGRVGPKGNALKEHLLRNVAPLPTSMVRTSILRELGGFSDLACGQEYELWLRLLGSGYGIDYCSEPLLRCHEHSGQRITNASRHVDALRTLHGIKRQYFSSVTPREARMIRHQELLVLYHAYLLGGHWLTSLWTLLQAMVLRPFHPGNLPELLGLVFGYRTMLRAKAALHRAVSWGRGSRSTEAGLEP